MDVFVKYLAKAEQYYIREAKFLRKQLSKPSPLVKPGRNQFLLKRLASKIIMPRSKMFLADLFPILESKKYYLNTPSGGYYIVDGHDSFKYGPLASSDFGPNYTVEKKYIFNDNLINNDIRFSRNRAVDYYIQEKDFFIYLEICQKEEQKFLLPIFYNLFVTNLTEFFFYYNLEKKIKALSFCVSYFIHYGEKLEVIFSPIMN